MRLEEFTAISQIFHEMLKSLQKWEHQQLHLLSHYAFNLFNKSLCIWFDAWFLTENSQLVAFFGLLENIAHCCVIIE